MKKCTRCGTTSNNFGKNKTKKDGLQSTCKSCVKEINANYYKRTPEKNQARRATNERMRQDARRFVYDFLKKNPCVDCGENDVVVLEFDHVRGEKHKNISVMMQGGYSLVRIASEIEKCDVRCANCHRRITFQRGGYIADMLL